MVILDPSFTRQDVVFVEGKSKAKLTYGTIKPGKTPHVDLDMIPKSPNQIFLSKANITYELPDKSKETVQLFSEDVLLVESKRS